MASNVELFLSRLNGVKQTGANKYMACCPAHDDRSPSLAIRIGDKDQVVFHCFAGCTPTEVVSALGLNFGDLYNDDNYTPKEPDLTNEVLILKLTKRALDNGVELNEIDRARAKLALRRLYGE